MNKAQERESKKTNGWITFLFLLLLLSACGEKKISKSETVSDAKVVVNTAFWNVYEVEVDGVKYLVAQSGHGISIIEK
jgi:hypothetical protein